MADRNKRNKVKILGNSENQKSYQDLNKSEIDRVNSALLAAVNLGKNRKKNLKKKDLEDSSFQIVDDTSSSEEDEEPETESSFKAPKSEKKDWYTLTINRKTRHRLEMALKLLEFVEGGGSDYDSDCSLSSVSSSLFLKNDCTNNKTSTPRVQALKKRGYKNY
nr:uncharacterized protein LOC108076971 [Drosophila kikkawai]